MLINLWVSRLSIEETGSIVIEEVSRKGVQNTSSIYLYLEEPNILFY